MPASPIRILVVDDHPIVRLGIQQMVSADPQLSVCGEAESLEGAVQVVSTGHVDLAIVDLSLEGGSGLDVIRALHAVQPDLPVLVLSMHDEELFAERALRAGARGYIMKQEAIENLVRAIFHVLSGRVYISERMSQTVLERLGQGASSAVEHLRQLTDRELEVFESIGRGLSTAEIADRLGVSIKTIETYRANIKTKLHLKDAADLIRYATVWSERL